MDILEINEKLLKYYHNKILEHGASALGVGWKDNNAQFIRFEQLLKLIQEENSFVINDLGCGYGMLYEFMSQKKYRNFTYLGYDLSSVLIENAEKLHKNSNNKFIKIKCANELKMADYTVASGIFNLKFDYSEKDWYKYVLSILDSMNLFSKKGFSFNCLTKYSDSHLMCKELFYADPCILFDLCKNKFSKNVAILHDYNIYDFTIIVRKYL